jgi:murein DD-endopeptidase MepM/ murein hydrolase activator NlpD
MTQGCIRSVRQWRVPQPVRVLLVLAAAFLLTGAHSRKVKRGRPEPPRIQPSAAIEARVSEEIAKSDNTLANLDGDRLFDSSYVASAVYYHEGFLSTFPEEKEDADPARRIISHAVRVMTPQLKAKYLELLRRRYADQLAKTAGSGYYLPVSWEPPSTPAAPARGRKKRRKRVRRVRQNHPHAIDLFVPEGSPVRSASKGVVILAESGWNMADPLSTSSRMGGNTVIVVDPEGRKMFRYCHLESVLVSAGEVVRGGQPIGAVGHTGVNASLPKHGGHLHFEVNDYDTGTVQALDHRELLAFLRRASPADPSASATGGR